MPEITRRRAAGALLFAALLAPSMGCRRPAPEPPAVARVTSGEPSEPGEIELSDPKVTFEEPDRVRFEVRYKFTKGKPEKYYLCEVTFPDTKAVRAKPMESWELKPEGVIKDSMVMPKPPPKTFEIRVSEADSPQAGYQKISNVASGPVK